MGNASQINRSRNSVRVERRSDLNESDLGEVYCSHNHSPASCPSLGSRTPCSNAYAPGSSACSPGSSASTKKLSTYCKNAKKTHTAQLTQERNLGSTRESDVKLHRIYREVCKDNKQCVIIGDFNHRTIDWDIPRTEHADQEFLEAVQDCYLTQHVREPTRGENILDLILSTEEHMIEDTTILPPLSNSDHNVICFSLIVEERLSENSTIKIVDYNKADWEGIRDALGRVEWDEWITDNATTEENLDTLTTILESACKGIPTRKKTRRKRSVWMNRKARKAIRKKTKTWKKYRQTGNAEDYEQYRKALNKATKTVRKAKGDFEIKLAAEIKRDSKSFFSYARSKLRTKEQIGPLCDMTGNLIDEPKLMAMLLNEFFSSVFTTEDQTNIPSLDCEVELMADITITTAEVQKKLQDLRTDKAPGADLIHPRLLKELAVQVA